MKKIISIAFILILVLSGCSTMPVPPQILQATTTSTSTIEVKNTSTTVPTITEVVIATPVVLSSTETLLPNNGKATVEKVPTPTGTPIQNEETLTDIVSSPDSKWIGYASSTGFKLLDKNTYQKVAFISSTSAVNGIDFSDDSTLIVIGKDDGVVEVYAVAALADGAMDGNELSQKIKAHSLPVTSVQFSNSSEVIISTSSDRTAVTWNVTTGKRIRTFTGFDADISTLVFSPDYRFIAVGSYDGTIRIWNVNSGHLWREYGESDGTRKLRAEYPSALLFDQTTGRLISGWGDGTIRIWQWEFGNEEALTISLGENSIINLIQYNTTNMISVDFYGNAILFNMASSANQVGVEKLQEFSFGKSIQSIVLLPADQILLLGRSPAQIDAFHLDGGEVNTLFSSAL